MNHHHHHHHLWSATTTAALDGGPFISSSSSVVPPSHSSLLLNQETLQQRLFALIEGTCWTYAIFWQSSVVDGYGPSLLTLGDGYYKGDLHHCNKSKTASSPSEQHHRRKVLRDLNSLISGPQPAVDEEVTDTEWFFLISMKIMEGRFFTQDQLRTALMSKLCS